MRAKIWNHPAVNIARLTGAALAFALVTPAAMADIDGHGPDAWRVVGVAPNDVLNVRMGPGTNYPVIEKFAHDERKLQQITCVPYHTLADYSALTEAQRKALPPRWCLMRDAEMIRAGWVAQRFITPDHAISATALDEEQTASNESQPGSGDNMIDAAQSLVRDLYAAHTRANLDQGDSPLLSPQSGRYFTSDIIAYVNSGQLGADPLFDAQDIDGHVTRIAPDPEQPMFRGMITINADYINFGQQGRAIFRLRAAPDGALRIFRIEHDGWSIP